MYYKCTESSSYIELRRTSLLQPDTRHDAELAAQLAGEYPDEPEASTATATATGFRLDPGAGPSTSPPAAGLRVTAERRGPGIAVAFDALREAKLATEVCLPKSLIQSH